MRATVRIEACGCGRPRQVGAACRSCGQSALTESLGLSVSLGAQVTSERRPPGRMRGGSHFTRSRLLRAGIIAPLLALLLIWSTLTPAVLVRVASLAICAALMILIVWPSSDPGNR